MQILAELQCQSKALLEDLQEARKGCQRSLQADLNQVELILGPKELLVLRICLVRKLLQLMHRSQIQNKINRDLFTKKERLKIVSPLVTQHLVRMLRI